MPAEDRIELIVARLEDLVRPRPSRRVVVPDVVGQPISHAARMLGHVGLRITTRTDAATPPPIEATVVAQSVPAGKRVRRTTRVTLDLAFLPPRG